jgi:hypothetical protein
MSLTGNLPKGKSTNMARIKNVNELSVDGTKFVVMGAEIVPATLTDGQKEQLVEMAWFVLRGQIARAKASRVAEDSAKTEAIIAKVTARVKARMSGAEDDEVTTATTLAIADARETYEDAGGVWIVRNGPVSVSNAEVLERL